MIDFRRNPDIYKAFYEGIIDEPFEGSGTHDSSSGRDSSYHDSSSFSESSDSSYEASGVYPPGFDQETRFNTLLSIEYADLEAKIRIIGQNVYVMRIFKHNNDNRLL